MIAKNHRLLLGAHMSTAGGYEQAILRGESIGCATIQLFTKSNRMWHGKKIDPEATDLFKETAKKSGINPLLSHASYLINIGSNNPIIYKKSLEALLDELERCQELGIAYLVLHPGSSGTESESNALERVAISLDDVLEQFHGSTMILLENMAGQGSALCYSLEQLALVRELVTHKKRIGVCIDTCHAFAAGYDLRTPATYQQFWKQFDSLIGLDQLKALHINDSKKELGSRVDRHEDIGTGLLGLEPFRLLMNDADLFDVPKILETPRAELKDYVRNMNTLKGLLSDKTRSLLEIE